MSSASFFNVFALDITKLTTLDAFIQQWQVQFHETFGHPANLAALKATDQALIALPHQTKQELAIGYENRTAILEVASSEGSHSEE